MENNKKIHNFSQEKNKKLKAERGIGFETIIAAIENECLLDIIEHPNKSYGNQRVYVVDIDRYVYLVPYVENDDGIFLKTIFPSRKFTKKYLRGGFKDE